MVSLRRARRIRRTRKGTIDVTLPAHERTLLGDLAAQLRELVLGDDDDGLRRLYPTAHVHDPELDAEYQSLVHGSLIEGRLAALDTLDATLAATTRIVFCSNSPLQEASAVGLEQANKRGFLKQQCDEYEERRNVLAAGFDKLGMRYTMPQGSYFVLLVRAGMCLSYVCRPWRRRRTVDYYGAMGVLTRVSVDRTSRP